MHYDYYHIDYTSAAKPWSLSCMVYFMYGLLLCWCVPHMPTVGNLMYAGL